MNGVVAPGFEAVADVVAECVPDDGPGGGFCAYVDGSVVVDVVSGVRDDGAPWRHDTTCVMASGTKGVVAAAMLVLVERGRLDLDQRVAAVWPEFAAAGKGDVRVGDVLAHTTGLAGVVAPVTIERLADPPSIEDDLAAQAPIVPIGEPSYHALTYGWLCDALVRRVDGRSIGRFVDDEISGPLGLDLSIGTPPERIARTSRPEVSGFRLSAYLGDEAPDPRLAHVYPAAISGRLDEPEVMALEVPGGNGVASASAMARLYGCLAAGGAIDGVRLLAPETIELGRRQRSCGRDPLSGRLLRFGAGFELNPNPSALGPPDDAFGHTGAGGSSHGAWPSHRVGFSFLPSRWRPETDDGRARRVLAALERAVG